MSATVLPFRKRQADELKTQSKLQLECDRLLEDRIQMAHELLLLATDETQQRRWWDEMKRLCSLRSVEQIARMERDRGLR